MVKVSGRDWCRARGTFERVANVGHFVIARHVRPAQNLESPGHFVIIITITCDLIYERLPSVVYGSIIYLL